MSAYRTWATISLSCIRKSGRRARFALTEEPNIVSYATLHQGNTRRTEQTQEILSGDTILQLLPLILDQLSGNFVCIGPVLSNVHHPGTFILLKKPGEETLRGPLQGVHHEYSSLGEQGECMEAMKGILETALVLKQNETIRQAPI